MNSTFGIRAIFTVRVHGTEYTTGRRAPRLMETGHRYTVLWARNRCRRPARGVDKDGVVAKRVAGVAQGYQIPGDGELVLAQDQDSVGGGFSPRDAFHGQLLDAGLARTPPDRARLAEAPLGAAMQGRASASSSTSAPKADPLSTTPGTINYGGRDQSPRHPQQVDTSVGAVRAGATLAMSLGAGAPRDRSDAVTGMVMSGLARRPPRAGRWPRNSSTHHLRPGRHRSM